MKVWKPLLLIAVLGATTAAAGAEAQRLTAYERAQGWRLLFDGRTLENWRGYRISKLPDSWQARDGNLVGHGGTPLITEERFGDFELTFDWCVVKSGTAEVYFHVWEDSAAPGDT